MKSHDTTERSCLAREGLNPTPTDVESLIEELKESALFLDQDIPTRPMRDGRLSSVDSRHLAVIAAQITQAANEPSRLRRIEEELKASQSRSGYDGERAASAGAEPSAAIEP